MKILLVIPYYIPAYSYGGPVKVAHDLAREFVKKGHSVTVVTTDAFDAKSRNKIKTENIEGVQIIRFSNLSNYLAKNFNAYLPFGFKKWIRRNLKNYDVVHCHDFFTYQNIVVSKYCAEYNIPYLVQPHGVLGKGHIKSKNTFFKRLILKYFKNILQNAKAILALTEQEKKSIESLLPANKKVPPRRDTEGVKADKQGGLKQNNKIHIIPNGIDLSEFQNIQKLDLHQKYKLPQETKLLFYFGRVQYIKGIDYILETLAQIPLLGEVCLKKSYRNPPLPFHLFIIGPDEGGEKARLEKLIEKYKLKEMVTFVGELNGEEKLRFISACDLFLFLSRGEGLPMTILEVAALGIPSMISKECNVPEIAKEGGGYELEKEDYEKNAKIILKHFQDEVKIKQMKTNVQKVIKNQFQLDIVVEKMLKLFQN